MFNMNSALTAGLTSVLALSATMAGASTLTAFSTFTDEIVNIDTATGTVTSVGGTYTGLANTVTGLAYDSSGTLWAITASPAANVSIGTVDPANGSFALIGTDSVGSLSGLAAAPDDTLYSVNNSNGGSPIDTIASVSKTDAVPTVVASLGVTTGVGFAITGDGLFGYTYDPNADNLLKYDFTLDTVSVVGAAGSLTEQISALAFVGTTLYATTGRTAGGDSLLTLDTATGGVLTKIGLSTGDNANISALAARPVPIVLPPDPPGTSEIPLPAGAWLLLSGLALLGLRRRSA